MSDVTIFAPSPTFTVTIEEHESGPDIHVHAGGQGVWQARMLRTLGVRAVMCCALAGETGRLVRDLLQGEGFEVVAIEHAGRGAAYVHDRRGGDRTPIAETEGDGLGRHELDELYGATLREGIATGFVILSGPDGDAALPADTYRRLAADLRANGVRVVVDLAGDRMRSALEGGVDVLKVSDEELRADGLVDDDDDVASLIEAMETLRARGAADVIVTRSDRPCLVLDGETVYEVAPPEMQTADTRGAGDSLTAGVCATLAAGEPLRDAILTGVAAGAINVTRHGLGTGDTGTIETLRDAVRVTVLRHAATPERDRVSPAGLAALAAMGDDQTQTPHVTGDDEQDGPA